MPLPKLFPPVGAVFTCFLTWQTPVHAEIPNPLGQAWVSHPVCLDLPLCIPLTSAACPNGTCNHTLNSKLLKGKAGSPSL